MKIVVDASVAIKWFIPEVHSISAMRLLEKKEFTFLAPDLIFAETGNILWKKHQRKELNLEDASLILSDFKKIPFHCYSSESLSEEAWLISTKYQRTFYDSLYVALAKKEKIPLVTADHALYQSLKNTSLAPFLLWVEKLGHALL